MHDPDAPWQINTLLIAGLAIIALAGPIVTAILTYRAAIRTGAAQAKVAVEQTELDARRVDHARIAALEQRVDILEDKRVADALIKRLQGDHIDVLEAHIWRGDPPPPPPRPEGV